MKGTLVSVSPRMKDGAQRSWDGPHGTMFYFNATVQDESGKRYDGEVGGKTALNYRFQPGDTIEFTVTEGQYGNKLKIESPKDGATAPRQNTERAKPAVRLPGNQWSPEKENSVMIQGFLKSIVEAGVKADHHEAALKAMLAVHDKVLAERMPKEVPAETTAPTGLSYNKAGAPGGRPVYQGPDVPGGPGIGDDGTDLDAPF